MISEHNTKQTQTKWGDPRACLDWGGKEVEESRVELAKNRLILDQIYSTLLSLPPSQSKQTIMVWVLFRKWAKKVNDKIV